MTQLPTREECLNRIKTHLRMRGDSETVHLLWKGYLAALMEWGLLQPNDYHAVNRELKDIGGEEVQEIFLGFPDEHL